MVDLIIHVDAPLGSLFADQPVTARIIKARPGPTDNTEITLKMRWRPDYTLTLAYKGIDAAPPDDGEAQHQTPPLESPVMNRRSWDQLTSEEQEGFLAAYYRVTPSPTAFANSPSVTDIIDEFWVAARPHSIPDFLPGADAEECCEMCESPLKLQALSRSACQQLSDVPPPSEAELRQMGILLVKPPGLSIAIPYQQGRTQPCPACLHSPRMSRNCSCNRCKARYKTEWREQFAESDEERHARQEAAARRRLEHIREVVATRQRHESLASQTPSTPLHPEARTLAAILLHIVGEVQEDGGLWLHIGHNGSTPGKASLPWHGEAMDSWVILGHLQAAGLVRCVGLGYLSTYDDYGRNQYEVMRYLVTASPDQAQELGLVKEPLLSRWRQALATAERQAGQP